MRSALVVVLLIAAATGAFFAFSAIWSGDPRGVEPAPGPAAGEGPVVSTAPADGLAPGTIATRTLVDAAQPEGLADAPTACLRVIDHETGQPIAGASVRRVQGGHAIAYTDDRGLAGVPLRTVEQLAVVMPDYLLRLVPTAMGSTEAEPQQVRLVFDRWSVRRRFHLIRDDGSTVPEALVRFAPVPATNSSVPGPADDPLLQRAWMEHTMLASRPVCADVAVQLGNFAADRVHHLADGDEVRFVAPGGFKVEAATTSGLVALAVVGIDAVVDAPPASLTFVRGAEVSGTVVDAASAPLAGAQLTVGGGDVLGLLATTAADGAFRIGPLPPAPLTLHVVHGDHVPQAVGPLAAPAFDVRVVMQPLPATTLRGRVRVRPDLAPLPGAKVIWTPSAGAAVTATTGPDGSFTLRATGDVAARLIVQAPGHLRYAELVAPGAPFADYDVWPATTEARLAKKLTAVLEGVVLDAQSRPLANEVVHWRPARRAIPAGLPDRRVLEGATLALPLLATTREDGSFALETEHFGPGRLTLAAGGDAASGGRREVAIEIEATAGATTGGLRLQR